jgi:hypothetical protein
MVSNDSLVVPSGKAVQSASKCFGRCIGVILSGVTFLTHRSSGEIHAQPACKQIKVT